MNIKLFARIKTTSGTIRWVVNISIRNLVYNKKGVKKDVLYTMRN